MVKLFVYGTLKRGFPLHAGLAGQSLVGMYRTVIRYPMVVAGPWFTPMMLNKPGRGLRVYGELYEVETNRLVSLDAIEHIGELGNFRELIEVEQIEGGASCAANVYFKARGLTSPIHTTYLESYQDRRFIPPWSRQSGMSASGPAQASFLV
jgi:gamma-glutamylaminecyclotransferase